MIKGKQIQPKVFSDKQTANYRKLSALNYSMIKEFDDNPLKFYDEFKMGKVRRRKRNTSMIIGDIVDFYILSCKGDDLEFTNRLEEKFVLYDGHIGSGQVFMLADYIFEEALSCLNDKNEITCPFSVMFDIAFNKIKYEGKYKNKTSEKALEDFYDNGKQYYDKLVDNIGKTVVDVSLIDKSKDVADRLLTDDFTKHIFRGHEDVEVLPHHIIQFNYSVEGKQIPCKCEVDMLTIDHEHRVIVLNDLKTTYDNELFELMYIKQKYYIQNAFYTTGVAEWAKQIGLGEYTVKPMRFIVGDTSANKRRPVIYETSTNDVMKGLEGFFFNGFYYRGVDELISEISWAEDNNIWNCSKATYEQNGQLKLNIKYDS